MDLLDRFQTEHSPAGAAVEVGEESAATGPEEIGSLPIEPGETWQAESRPMPAWITGEGAPYRPWMALVVSQTDDLILAHQTMRERPRATRLWESILQAIRQPAVGEPHRPGLVEVNSQEQRDALLPLLDPIGIECVAVERLAHLDSAFDSMAQHFIGQGPPAIMDAPGIQPEQAGSFYAAAAEFYRRKPWQRVPSDTIIKVECAEYRSGPWYAVVMGQSGVEQGLALYEDPAALKAMIAGNASEAENARGMSAISLMFSEAFNLSTRDLDAAEKLGWQVAGPEAYPLVIRVNPGPAVRARSYGSLNLWKVVCVRSPSFSRKRKHPERRQRQRHPGYRRCVCHGFLNRPVSTALFRCYRRPVSILASVFSDRFTATFRPSSRQPSRKMGVYGCSGLPHGRRFQSPRDRKIASKKTQEIGQIYVTATR